MGDPIAKAIDDFFGGLNRVTDTLVDGFDTSDRVEHHAKAMKAKHDARKADSKGNVLMLEHPRYRVEEVTDAESGEVSYDVVSADGTERMECNSRAAADKVHRALEARR